MRSSMGSRPSSRRAPLFEYSRKGVGADTSGGGDRDGRGRRVFGVDVLVSLEVLGVGDLLEELLGLLLHVVGEAVDDALEGAFPLDPHRAEVVVRLARAPAPSDRVQSGNNAYAQAICSREMIQLSRSLVSAVRGGARFICVLVTLAAPPPVRPCSLVSS